MIAKGPEKVTMSRIESNTDERFPDTSSGEVPLGLHHGQSVSFLLLSCLYLADLFTDIFSLQSSVPL